MKHILLLGLLWAFAVQSYGQEIRMTEDARKEYLNKRQDRQRNQQQVQRAPDKEASKADGTNLQMAYAAIELLRDEADEGYRVELDLGTGRQIDRQVKEFFAELEQLGAADGYLKSDIDYIQYLATRDWEVFSVTRHVHERKGYPIIRLYVRKAVPVD